MSKTLRKIHILVDCLRRAVRIARLPGGAAALSNKLTDLEREIRANPALSRCPGCGSTELEPLLAKPANEVVGFRCKACGGEVPSS